MKKITVMDEIERIITNSKFYQRKIERVKYSSLQEFPFTTKKEIIADQEEFPPFGSNLCVSMEKVSRIHKTSGTTNKPVIVAMTLKDIEHTVTVGGLSLHAAGASSTDLIFHCLNYNMWAGGYTDHQSLERTGATVVPYGVGNTDNLLEMMYHLGATGIHCTPSYMSKIEDACERVLKITPKQLGLRIGLFGGESGMQNPQFRKRLEDTWGISAMNANYGLSEVLSIVASECSAKNGLHFTASNVLYPELVDPVTGCTIPLKTGSAGELVLTNLCKEAQPLIRYRTGDIIRVLDGSCSCEMDSEAFRFEVIGRADDMFVYKGLNVFPSSIELVLGMYLDSISSLYQILISSEDPIERMILRLEVLEGCKMKAMDIEVVILQAIASKLGIKPEIEILPAGTIPRTEGKHKKIIRAL